MVMTKATTGRQTNEAMPSGHRHRGRICPRGLFVHYERQAKGVNRGNACVRHAVAIREAVRRYPRALHDDWL